MSLRFTGHETFVVRTFWPKKGYDFIKKGGTFSAENAVVDLGVGKNMVASIQFWMKALGIFNDGKKELTEIKYRNLIDKNIVEKLKKGLNIKDNNLLNKI